MAIRLIVVTLILLTVHPSSAFSLDDIIRILDSLPCSSYRFLPCQNEIVEKCIGPGTQLNKTEVIFRFDVSTCIAFQSIKCQDDHHERLKGQYGDLMKRAVRTMDFYWCSMKRIYKEENDFKDRLNKIIREKKLLSNYMVSQWDTRSIDEDAEKAKAIKDRMLDYIRYSVARLGLLELKQVEKLEPDFGEVYNDILSFQYPLNIQSCPNAMTTSGLPSLFVAVTGVATDNNRKRRDKIRKIFLNEIKDLLQQKLFSSINFGFFLGKPDDDVIQSQIEEEREKNKDIVQVDMIDSGRNSSLKLAAIFNWVRLNCAKVDVIFKMDENFEKVTLKKLGSFVSETKLTATFVYGVKGNTVPFRGEGRRKITLEEFPWTTFPTYLNGLAYFITGNMVNPLMAAFQTIPMIPLEDVYLGLSIIKADVKKFTYCGKDVNLSSCF